jgi:hypothetical protein
MLSVDATSKLASLTKSRDIFFRTLSSSAANSDVIFSKIRKQNKTRSVRRGRKTRRAQRSDDNRLDLAEKNRFSDLRKKTYRKTPSKMPPRMVSAQAFLSFTTARMYVGVCTELSAAYVQEKEMPPTHVHMYIS